MKGKALENLKAGDVVCLANERGGIKKVRSDNSFNKSIDLGVVPFNLEKDLIKGEVIELINNKKSELVGMTQTIQQLIKTKSKVKDKKTIKDIDKKISSLIKLINVNRKNQKNT